MHRFLIENSALILVDHQVGTSSWVGSIEGAELKRNALLLAKFATAVGMPMVLTSSLEDQVQGPLFPELKDVAPVEYESRVKRTGIVNAWDDEAFASACRGAGRRNLVMAGVTTDVCLVPPATSAVLEGFAVKAVLDASGSPNRMVDEVAWTRLMRAGVELTTTNAIVSELVRDWGSHAGHMALGLLMGLSHDRGLVLSRS